MRTLAATTFDRNTGRVQDLEFRVDDGLESLRQRVIFRLQFWFGQWFLDQRAGVPYQEEVLGFAYDSALARAAITDQVASVPEVDNVSDVVVRLDNATRHLDVSLTVHSRFGSLQVATAVAA